MFFSFFQKGEIHPVSVKVGEKVLLPEYGGTKVILDDKVRCSFLRLRPHFCAEISY